MKQKNEQISKLQGVLNQVWSKYDKALDKIKKENKKLINF